VLKDTQINKLAIQKVARALGDLNEKVVYVGGAIVSLYIDDLSAEDVRPTKDVDITLQIASVQALENLREKLNNKGFKQSSEDDVVCRFRFEDVKVDVMSTKPVGWAPANKWFDLGFDKAKTYSIDGIEIRILSLPYFLATKFSAFNDRGGNDARYSHDFEDIVYLLNYIKNLAFQLEGIAPELKSFLIQEFEKVLSDQVKQEAILGNLFHENQMDRYNRIINVLTDFTN
tara:strand:- start:54 stop:743 length:690 start_codon:yes stop_codon:yes gene_type:complete